MTPEAVVPEAALAEAASPEAAFPEAHATHRVGDPDVDPGARAPLVENERTISDVTESVAGIIEKRAPRWWLPALLLSGSVAGIGILAVVYLVATGVGVWGLNSPVGWAFDITNFVFWIGIGHAGTLISRHPVPAAPALAHEHQPRRRGDDPLRRGVRRPVPAHPRRAPLADLLHRPGPESPRHLAELQAARCSGTCSPSRPTPPCPCSSGTWA